MRYLCLYKSVETGPPTQAEMESMGALIQEWTSAGTLLAAEGCQPRRSAPSENPEHRGYSSRSGLLRPFTPASSSRLLTVTSL